VATRNYTISPVLDASYLQSWQITWTGLTNGDTGQALQMPAWADRSVQIVSPGSTGTIVIEGSNDGTNYKTLTDPQGNSLSFTSAGLEEIMEATIYVRPRISAGDGSTNYSVYMLVTGYRG